MARRMGYATHLGKKRVLCQFTKLQKTRFVVWKARAVKRWLKNIFALIPYLQETRLSDKTRGERQQVCRNEQRMSTTCMLCIVMHGFVQHCHMCH